VLIEEQSDRQVSRLTFVDKNEMSQLQDGYEEAVLQAFIWERAE